MSTDINRVILRGRVGQEPDFSHTNSGTPRCRLSVATSSEIPKKDGSPGVEEIVHWHTVVAWAHVAVQASRLVVGQAVLVEGELRHRSWTGEEGKKAYASEVVALGLVPLALPRQKAGGQ